MRGVMTPPRTRLTDRTSGVGASAFGRVAGTSFSVLIFALSEREDENLEIEDFPAAAGAMAI